MKNFTRSVATLLLSSIILFSFGAKAQNSFGIGTSVINLGVGIGYSYDYYSGEAGVSSTPVISGSYEYGVARLGPGSVGLGVQIAYQGASYSTSYPFYDYNYYNPATPTGYGPYSATVNDSWSSFLFGVRGVYHPDFCNGTKYDVYGAIQLTYIHAGYSTSSTTNDPYGGYNPILLSDGSNGSSFLPYLVIGGRYYLSNSIGIWAELGYSLAYLNIGINIKVGSSGGGK